MGTDIAVCFLHNSPVHNIVIVKVLNCQHHLWDVELGVIFIQAVNFTHVRKQVTTRHIFQQIVEVTIVLIDRGNYYTGNAQGLHGLGQYNNSDFQVLGLMWCNTLRCGSCSHSDIASPLPTICKTLKCLLFLTITQKVEICRALQSYVSGFVEFFDTFRAFLHGKNYGWKF